MQAMMKGEKTGATNQDHGEAKRIAVRKGW
jgi:hypothetical protein